MIRQDFLHFLTCAWGVGKKIVVVVSCERVKCKRSLLHLMNKQHNNRNYNFFFDSLSHTHTHTICLNGINFCCNVSLKACDFMRLMMTMTWKVRNNFYFIFYRSSQALKKVNLFIYLDFFVELIKVVII